MLSLYKPLYLAGCAFLVSAMPVEAEVTTGIDPDAQLPYWEYSTSSMSLRLVQRLPIQTRGYFLARGFNKVQAERIAQSCVFQTVFKNNSHLTKPSPLTYNLRDWVVLSNGIKQGLKTREDWNIEWQQELVATPLQVAFEWSLYPTTQEYKAGDYNWGMSVFNLKPGARFDLQFSWQQYGQIQYATIKNIQCAPDINPQPVEVL